jgi:hypothetical protein
MHIVLTGGGRATPRGACIERPCRDRRGVKFGISTSTNLFSNGKRFFL